MLVQLKMNNSEAVMSFHLHLQAGLDYTIYGLPLLFQSHLRVCPFC